MRKCYIYALYCPITKIPFYIGKSYTPISRLIAHVNNPQVLTGYITKELAEHGYIPKMEILEECTENNGFFWETFYINLFMSWNFTLLNININTTKSHSPKTLRIVWNDKINFIDNYIQSVRSNIKQRQ